MWTIRFECWPSLNLMSWWRMKTIRSSSSSSSMSFLCVLWLLTVCLAPGSRSQRLRETEGEQPAVSAQLAERDALCHQEGCYAVFLQKRTFREAGRSCRERGGTLATMHNHEAAGVVHELLSAIEAQGTRVRFRLWIGLHRPPRQCSSTRPLRGFVWVTGKFSPLWHLTFSNNMHFNNWAQIKLPPNIEGTQWYDLSECLLWIKHSVFLPSQPFKISAL